MNKVVIGASALLANGGLMAPVGTQVVAQAAKLHAVPVVVLVGLHKLSPLFPHDPGTRDVSLENLTDLLMYPICLKDRAQTRCMKFASKNVIQCAELTMNDFRTPAEILDFEALTDAMPSGDPSVTLHVNNPSLDYVPPGLVSLLVTDMGGYSPSFVYRLVEENFSKEDSELAEVALSKQ